MKIAETKEIINTILKIVMYLAVTLLPVYLLIDSGRWQAIVIGNLRAFIIPIILVILAQLLILRNTYGVWCLRDPALEIPGKGTRGLLHKEIVGLIVLLCLVIIVMNFMAARYAQISVNADMFSMAQLVILVGLMAAYLIMLDRHRKTLTVAYGPDAFNHPRSSFSQNWSRSSSNMIAENYLILWCVVAELVLLIIMFVIRSITVLSGFGTEALVYTGIAVAGIIALFWTESQYMAATEQLNPSMTHSLKKIPARLFITGVIAVAVMIMIGWGISGLAVYPQVQSLPVLGAIVSIHQFWLVTIAVFFSPVLVYVVFRPH